MIVTSDLGEPVSVLPRLAVPANVSTYLPRYPRQIVEIVCSRR